jgi:hypothetical protein
MKEGGISVCMRLYSNPRYKESYSNPRYKEEKKTARHSTEIRADERWDSQKKVKRTAIWGMGRTRGNWGRVETRVRTARKRNLVHRIIQVLSTTSKQVDNRGTNRPRCGPSIRESFPLHCA